MYLEAPLWLVNKQYLSGANAHIEVTGNLNTISMLLIVISTILDLFKTSVQVKIFVVYSFITVKNLANSENIEPC